MEYVFFYKNTNLALLIYCSAKTCYIRYTGVQLGYNRKKHSAKKFNYSKTKLRQMNETFSMKGCGKFHLLRLTDDT